MLHPAHIAITAALLAYGGGAPTRPLPQGVTPNTPLDAPDPFDSATVDSDTDTDPGDSADTDTDSGGADTDTEPPTEPAVCPDDMVEVPGACMDRYEAPNIEGGLPLVMYSFDEADAWCEARDKRLCFDDEWQAACEGAAGSAYPYGDAHEPGRCNDEEIWRVYSQDALNQWPSSASASDIDSLDELLAAVRSAGADIAADEIEELYQGEGGGANTGCGGDYGAYDLVGNVEEWTRRRDGGEPSFHGNLKGRYWAESRTCQSAVTSHGDPFRFYEIGFRCCAELSR